MSSSAENLQGRYEVMNMGQDLDEVVCYYVLEVRHRNPEPVDFRGRNEMMERHIEGAE